MARPKTTDGDTRNLNLTLPVAVRRGIKERAAHLDTSASAVVVEAWSCLEAVLAAQDTPGTPCVVSGVRSPQGGDGPAGGPSVAVVVR